MKQAKPLSCLPCSLRIQVHQTIPFHLPWHYPRLHLPPTVRANQRLPQVHPRPCSINNGLRRQKGMPFILPIRLLRVKRCPGRCLPWLSIHRHQSSPRLRRRMHRSNRELATTDHGLIKLIHLHRSRFLSKHNPTNITLCTRRTDRGCAPGKMGSNFIYLYLFSTGLMIAHRWPLHLDLELFTY